MNESVTVSLVPVKSAYASFLDRKYVGEICWATVFFPLVHYISRGKYVGLALFSCAWGNKNGQHISSLRKCWPPTAKFDLFSWAGSKNLTSQINNRLRDNESERRRIKQSSLQIKEHIFRNNIVLGFVILFVVTV